MPKPLAMHASPSSVSGYALPPVEASEPLNCDVVVVTPAAVDVGPSGEVVVVVSRDPPVVTVDGTDVVVDPGVDVVVVLGAVVAGVVVEVPGAVVLVVSCGDVVVVYGAEVVVFGYVVVVFGAVVGGATVTDLQSFSRMARPADVQFLPAYVRPGPKSNGGMMSPHFWCFGIAGKNTGPLWPS
jgi:hypothetical protein